MSTLITSPICYILVLLAAAYICRRRRKTRIALITAAVVFTLFFSIRPIYEQAEKAWCGEYSNLIPAGKTYDYGIVLGGYGEWDPDRNRPEFDKHADRLLEGIQLYHKGKIRKLIIASDSSNRQTDNPDETQGNPAAMRAYITRLGIPDSALILENTAKTTRENASTIKALLKKAPSPSGRAEEGLLITSAIHLPRALMTFQEEGIICDPYATDCIVSDPHQKNRWFPNLTVMRYWQSLLHEVIGYAYYKLRPTPSPSQS